MKCSKKYKEYAMFQINLFSINKVYEKTKFHIE